MTTGGQASLWHFGPEWMGLTRRADLGEGQCEHRWKQMCVREACSYVLDGLVGAGRGWATAGAELTGDCDVVLLHTCLASDGEGRVRGREDEVQDRTGWLHVDSTASTGGYMREGREVVIQQPSSTGVVSGASGRLTLVLWAIID